MRLHGLHRAVRDAAEWALSVAEYYGVPVTVTSGHRTWEEQQRLYANYVQCLQEGRMGQGPDCLYPANRPGDSAHNWGLAWDSHVPGEYQEWWNQVREYIGFKVLENDVIHAEVPGWRGIVSTWPAHPR